MACIVTSGRAEPCKDSLGGLKAAYFINFQENAFTIVDGEVTALDPSVTDAFKYELRADTNLFSQAVVSDKNTGTTVNTETITLALKRLDKDASLQVDLMAKGRPFIILRDRNDNYVLAGEAEGCDLTGSDITTGGARADFNGYNLTFEAQEGNLAPFLDAATITALEAIATVDPVTIP